MKVKKQLSGLVLSAVTIWAVSSCEVPKGVAYGEDDQIIVVADSTQWANLEQTLRVVFEQKVYTPREEKVLKLRRIPPEAFDAYKERKNIIMIGTLQAEGPVSGSIRNMLTDEVRQGVENGEYFVFTREDEWARGQVLMILVSTHEDDLAYYMRENEDELFKRFDEAANKHIMNYIYDQFEKKDLAKRIFRDYGWRIRIQQEYELRADSAEINYVRFHNISMHKNIHRWISIRWFDADEATADSFLTPEWIKEQRTAMGLLFSDPVESNAKYDTIRAIEFNGEKAFRYDGVWKTIEGFFGGPFRSYIFHDKKTRRIYFINTTVFDPKDEKSSTLRKMGVIAGTFTTDPKDPI